MRPRRESETILQQVGCEFLLAKASTDEERERIGNQTGGKVAFFWLTNDIDADYAKLSARGVTFLEKSIRNETYGRVIVMSDKFGNKFDLMQK